MFGKVEKMVYSCPKCGCRKLNEVVSAYTEEGYYVPRVTYPLGNPPKELLEKYHNFHGVTRLECTCCGYEGVMASFHGAT